MLTHVALLESCAKLFGGESWLHLRPLPTRDPRPHHLNRAPIVPRAPRRCERRPAATPPTTKSSASANTHRPRQIAAARPDRATRAIAILRRTTLRRTTPPHCHPERGPACGPT